MINIKKIIDPIRDSGVSLQERLFRLLTLVGLIGMGITVVLTVALGEGAVNYIGMILGFIILFGITYFSIHYRKIQVGAVIIGGLLVYLVMPYNYLTTGGLYGGGSSWFLLAFVFVALIVEKKAKYVLLVTGLIVSWGCYLLSYLYPSLPAAHTVEMAYTDVVLSLTMVSAITCGMILFQNAIYRSANRTAQQQKREIEELNQAQNRFFSSMSHEIRTPINTIIGLNEMILREATSDEIASDARDIQTAGNMLLALINDILDMSKIESGKMDIVPVSYDVGAMLSDIVNMIWVRAKEKGLEFHIDVDRKIPAQLLGDEVRIKQVLINVLNNAVKYTAEGAITLSIQCRRQEHGRVQIVYSVADTGMGIKKENMPYLFSAFKRVDVEKNRHIEGTGLGLSIVKQLVDLMGGDISVNSVYMKGTTFVITLPQEIVSEEELGDIDIEARHALNARKLYKKSFEAPRARVLIVDDNETNLMVAEKLLRDTKVQTETAVSGAECLRKTLQNRYDVILMDHLMPEMDGIACLHEIRTQAGGLNPETPVVVLTANAGGENRRLYKREGFDGYLTKPVTGGQLEAELLKHLPRELVTMAEGRESFGVVQAPFVEHAKKKKFLLISTDSVSDLPGEMTDNARVAVMPYRVVTEGGEFIDGQETGTDGVLSYIRNGRRAHSEAPGIAEYEAFFAEQLTKAQCVIHLTMSGKVSKGYENALEASKSFDNVEVIDTGHLSSGMGFIVLQAAAYAADGMSKEAVIEGIQQMRSHVRTSFIVDDTEYLLRAGRISPRINRICRAFMVHPVLVLKNSKMTVGAVMIGTQKTAWKKYIASALQNAGRIDKRLLFITYAGLSYEELQEIENMVRKKIAFERVIYQKASPAISINCGAGAFGLLFKLYKGK